MLASNSFRLSGAGIMNIPFYSNRESKCQIFIGQSEITISKLYADFVSPKIAKIHSIDPLIESITLISDEEASQLLTDDVKEFLKTISTGDKANLNSEIGYKMRFISIYLENTEIYQFIAKHYPINQQNDDPLQYINDIFQYKCDFTMVEEFDDCVKYISSNFYKLDENILLNLPPTAILAIISNNYLKVQNEDLFLDFIQKLISKICQNNDDIDISTLYDKINLSALSSYKFNSFMSSLNRNDMNGQMWKNLLNFFNCSINQDQQSNHQMIEQNVNILYDEIKQDRFNGIIHYLTLKCGGNPHIKGEMKVEAKMYVREWDWGAKHRFPEYVLDFDNKLSYFDSCIGKDKNEIMYLTYNFIKRKVRPSSYSIRSRDKSCDRANLVDWIIEGSNDNKNWLELDSRTDDKYICHAEDEHTYHISPENENNQFFQYLRIGCKKSTNNDRALVFAALEYFGTIRQ